MPKPGCCKYCGCTEGRACVYVIGGTSAGDGRWRGVPQLTACCWINQTRTVCSAPRCVARFLADLAR